MAPAKIALVLLAVLIASNVAVAGNPSPRPAEVLAASPEPAAEPPPAAAVSPALKGATGWVDVTVLTQDVPALAAALEGIPHRGLVGRDAAPGLAAPTLTLPAWAVDAVAALPGTIAVTPVEYPQKHLVEDPEADAGNRAGLTNYNSTINLGALEAWGNGFRGAGVNVAIVDDGLDFSHPDLQGTAARVANVSSPYYPMPMAFDPFSMGTYLAPIPDTTTPAGKTEGTWYVNTSSTDRNVTHTLRVDGKNDFWTDGTELVGTDLRGDVAGTSGEPDYDLITIYVTQDTGFWYFGFNSLANQTNMSFGAYINTTTSAPYTAGAMSDPAGNFVDTVATQRPEVAVYFRHYGLQSDPNLYDRNDTIPAANVYAWSGSAWGGPTAIDDASIGGAFSYSGWSFQTDTGFVEFSLPKAFLGDPASLSVEVFTVGVNASHAQDTVYSDPNVDFPVVDWSATTTTLSAAVGVGSGFWRHTYTRPDDTIGGQLNTQLLWSTIYQVTGTSQSGNYFFGDLPDDNFPLTRVLVVDEAASGQYDTVYVDLDHNKDFTNDKPQKRYGEYDPARNWYRAGSGTCPGPCTVFDEFSWGDFFDPALGVTAVDWSPSGALIASGSNDHTVILWSTATWTKVNQLNSHLGRITDVAFSPDGTKLAAAVDDASGVGDFDVVVWSTATWQEVGPSFSGHTARVNAVAWNAASTQVVSASDDGTARIWQASTGATLATLTGHTGPVKSVSWSSTGRIATGSTDGTVRVWSSAGAFQPPALTYTAPITAVDITANETWIAAGAQDGNVVLFDRASGLYSESGPGAHFGNAVLRVRWGPTGDLASSSAAASIIDASVVTWSVTNWDSFSVSFSVNAHVKDNKGWAAAGLDWGPAGTFLVSGGMEKNVKVWSPALIEQQSLGGHADGSNDPTRYRNGDGIADVSGGMVYFIADSTNPIPYSDKFAARLGVTNLIPAAGQLLALFGAYDAGSSHGTLMASSIVGQSRSRLFDPSTMDEPSFPQVTGIAPDAKLIAIGDIYVTTIFDAWFFAAEGYDGQPGTGDEANVVANSFGFSSTYQDGWDVYSRFIDYVSAIHGGDAAAFTVSSGNDGNGYGTVTSPASAPNVLTVGASTDFYYRKHAGLEQGPSQSFGDVVPFSSRGPTAQGRPDPDILATGRMSVGATPLNLRSPYNGAVASELWSGTSLASPMAAGGLALVYQAYKWRTGAFPDAATAKSLLTSGADDTNNDVFAQGAGLMNVARATRLAARLDGLAVSPSLWVPGDYHGTTYEAFANFLGPGEADAETFTVENRNASAGDTALFSTGVYRLVNEVNYGFLTTVDTANAPQPDWSYFFVNTGLAGALSGPGVYRKGAAGFELQEAIDPVDWLQADLLRFVFYTNTSSLDPNLDGAFDYRYMVDAYDWTWDGVSLPLPDTTGFKDLNRMSINHPDANHWEARIHNPASRTHTGLVMGFRPFGAGAADLFIQASAQLYRRVPWNWVTLNKISQGLANGASTTVGATLAVPVGTPVGTYEGGIYVEGNEQSGSWSTVVGSFGDQYFGLPRYNLATATVRVNTATQTAGVDYDLYARGGGIAFANLLNAGDLVEVDYTYREVSTIPVAVTVPAPSIEFTFGGSAAGQDDLYGNHVDMGFGSGGQGGDWHFFFVDVPPQGLFSGTSGVRFLVDTQWQYGRTDLQAYAFGPGGGVPPALGVNFPSTRYGDYLLMTNNGGSEETSTFFTTTGGAREIVAPKLAGGLNVIAVRQVRLNGTVEREAFSGSVGLMSATPDSLTIVTNQLAGTTSLQMWSSIPWAGLGAVSAGPSAPESYVDVPIKQDNVDGDFIELLAKGSYTRAVRILPSALIFDVHITSDAATTARPCPDLDLGVFLDGKGAGNAPNGIAEVSEFIAYGADQDADEEVKLIKPVVEDDPDTAENELVTGAPYLIKVLGYIVPYSPTGTFNIAITLVQGAGFSVFGTTLANLTAYEVSTVFLAWNLPGSTPDGRMLGALYVGPGNAPLTLLVPVDLILDRAAPTVSERSIATRTGFRTDAATRSIVNDPVPTLVVTVRDADGRLDPTRLDASFDGAPVTPWVTRNFPVTATGIIEGTLTYTPPQPLTEDGHTFEVTAYDTAGNPVTAILPFTVDFSAPSFALDVPARWHTAAANVTVSGTTDPGATVILAGQSQVVGANGRFTATLSLPDGSNRIEVTVVDWFDADASGNPIPGNPYTTAVTVVVDRTAPTITLRVPTTVPPSREPTGRFLATVTDVITPGLDTAPADLTATVGGEAAYIRGDGTLEVLVPLDAEGANVVPVSVTDPAGNTATATVTFVRDTVPPTLTMDAVPASVTGGTLTLSGATAGATTLLVNGRLLTLAANGSFSDTVELSPGKNDILVVAQDAAGNMMTQALSVSYASGRAPGTSLLVAGLGAAVAVVVGLLVALLFFGRRGEVALEEAPPPPEEAPPVADERLERLEKAYASGKIDQTTYEANLTKLRSQIAKEKFAATIPEELPSPEELPAPAKAPSGDEKMARLEKAYREGKINQATYEANLAKLKAAKPAAAALPPVEGRTTRLEKAFQADTVNRDAYEANLAELDAEQAGKEGAPGVEKPAEAKAAPTGEDKVVRLEAAYREGKISKETYEANLARLKGVPPPAAPAKPSTDDRGAKLEQAYREGRLSRGAYETNLARLKGQAPKAPEDERVAKLKKAFEEGKISKEAYEANLRRLKPGK